MINKRKRFEVLRRGGYTCFYCGRRPPFVILEVDHRIPRSKGGGDNYENLVAACRDCNRGKKDHDGTPEISDWERMGYSTWEEWQEQDFEDLCPDRLPWWFSGPTGKYHPRLKFDVYSVAASLPMAIDYPMSIWDVMQRAEDFDPIS